MSTNLQQKLQANTSNMSADTRYENAQQAVTDKNP